MLRKLTPTVLALAIGASSLSAASLAERGEHLEAIKALADQGLRLPAERLAAAYAKAGYPDDGGAKSALDFYLADVFRSVAPDPQNKEYEATYARLQPQIEKLLADPAKLPPDVKSLLGGGGGNATLLRLVNDVLRVMNPDQPPPLVPLTDEKIEQLNRSVKGIIDTARKDYEAAKKKVAAHAKDEEEVWNLPEDSKEALKINQDAVELRMEAMRPLYYAHLALREAAFRGDQFKSDGGKKSVDPKPAAEFFRTVLEADREALEKWDYEFSDYHPQLKLYMATLFAEAAKLGVKGVSLEDAEGHFIGPGLIDRDLSAYKDLKVRDSVQKVVLKGWAGLLRWRLELNNKAAIDRGIDNWKEFQNRAKNDKTITLASPDAERARTLGETWILAGRLFAARGDSASASALWSEVIAAKNPHAFDAKRWLTKSTTAGASDGHNPWEDQPTAADPASSLTGAKAFMAEGKNANPKQQRQYYLNAAVTLRNAVLGLNSSAYDEQFVENGPAVYYWYSLALSKLDMPYHAAIAAHDGLRAVTSHITDKANPWKDAKSGEWTQSGQMVRSLAQNSLAYISQLKANTKGNGTDRLYADISKLCDKIDPELVGFGATAMSAKAKIEDGKYEEAIEELREAAKKSPENYFKAFMLMTSARLQWAQSLRESKDAKAPEQLTKVIDDLTKSTEAVEGKVKELLKTETDPAKKKELENALRTCLSARVGVLLNAKKYDDVLTQLGPVYWQTPPADRDLAASMLRNLAQAVYEGQAELLKANDSAKLVEAWPRYLDAANVFKKQAPRLEQGDAVNLKNAGTMMAAGLQKIAAAANALGQKDPKAAAIEDPAKAAFAEILGRYLDDKTKPQTIYFVAKSLWSVDDKAGAARLYELYKRTLDANAELQAYMQDPATTIDAYAATLATRSEFKQPWAELRDLLVDKPGFMNDYRTAESIRSLPEKKRDFQAAANSVEGFKKLVTSQKNILSADQAKTMEESVGKLAALVDMLATNITVSERLANYYRSSGQAQKAIPIYQWLFNEYDPLNPDYGAGYVEGVLQAIKEGGALDQKAVEEARGIAGKIASSTENNPALRDTFWMAYIQVFELSAALKDTATIEKALTYLQKNKSTPRDDLILPPQPGDDPKVRRARDELAAALAERYLHVFDHVQNVKPAFRVDRLSAGGKPVPVFIDIDAPPMEARVEVKDGDERVVVAPSGAAPAGDAPADAAAPADAGAKPEGK